MAHLASLNSSNTYQYVHEETKLPLLVKDKLLTLGIVDGLCVLCSQVSFRELEKGSVFMYSFDYVRKSATQDCKLCSLMLRCTADDEVTHESIPLLLWGNRRRLSAVERRRGFKASAVESLVVSRGHRSRVDPALALIADGSNPAAGFIRRRPEVSNLGSPEAFALVEQWLEECRRKHPDCRARTDAIPIRLLNVASADGPIEPHLVTDLVATGRPIKYTALSYCWGGQQEVVLTKARIQSGDLQFQFAALPATIRDAIAITRRLGFHYVWIDALCIIQDDDGVDFQAQGARMHEVYGNANLTIAASAGHDVNRGILLSTSKGTDVDSKQFDVKLPYDMPNGVTGEIYFEYEPAMHGKEQACEPLNTRGWALQERVLPPRVLVYREDQLTWDCNTSTWNSKGPLEYFDGISADSPGRLLDDQARKDYWARLIESYTQRNLTRPTDKLKALSGLARTLYEQDKENFKAYKAYLRQEAIKNGFPPTAEGVDAYHYSLEGFTFERDLRYHAGVWVDHNQLGRQEARYWADWASTAPGAFLAERFNGAMNQLLWAVDGPSQRPDQYRAPTWSWASIDGCIQTRSHAFIDPSFSILDIKTEPLVRVDPFGEVTSGFMIVRGNLQQICLQPNCRDAEHLNSSRGQDGKVLGQRASANAYAQQRYPADQCKYRANSLEGLVLDVGGKREGPELPLGIMPFCLQITEKFYLLLLEDYYFASDRVQEQEWGSELVVFRRIGILNQTTGSLRPPNAAREIVII